MLKKFEPIIKAESHKYNIKGLTHEDIAQEIRIKLWLKEKQFNPNKSSYKTWANKVMRNCIKDIMRQAGAKKQVLNRALSIEGLQKNGFDIDSKGRTYKFVGE